MDTWAELVAAASAASRVSPELGDALALAVLSLTLWFLGKFDAV